jgi:heme-degrading monooxygenase HmoA
MIGLFFEVTPKIGHEQAYFDIAASLRPELQQNEGLLFIDRFKSRSRPRLVLSHSTWRDEASLARWRTHAKHHVAQLAGRQQHFEDYRIRIAQLVAEWLPENRTPIRLDINATYNDPMLQKERFIVAAATQSLQEAGSEYDHFDSVYRANEVVLLRTAESQEEGFEVVRQSSASGRMTSVRLYLISRDYSMHDRREAPQYYPPVKVE